MLFVQHLVQDSIRLQTKAFQSDSSHGFSVMSKIGWVGKYLPVSLRLLNFMFLCVVDLLISIITVGIFSRWLLCPYIVHATRGRARLGVASSVFHTWLLASSYRSMQDEQTLLKLFLMRGQALKRFNHSSSNDVGPQGVRMRVWTHRLVTKGKDGCFSSHGVKINLGHVSGLYGLS